MNIQICGTKEIRLKTWWVTSSKKSFDKNKGDKKYLEVF
jgi:hypothetical protein